ncbi:histidine phosphatase family protein [Nonomuraea turcica]|uniref:histidine phosphatase family protein n=1 Tax=Nonomuraea sp. G32 TaxID=3067274 RepID=UPI00273BF0D4|nr:histidine phosphatase family protein [Nonomuraea sp. G32]MDP4507077.1 histidine phosphatase family protein [Nonomuraea sp. G32]
MRSSLALLAACACLLAGCGGPVPLPAAPSPAPAASSSVLATSPESGATADGGPATADAGLAGRLRRGGYVLYIRHTATEATQDDPNPDLSDPSTQRNLSAEGRAQAREIGQAVRRLRIPIGEVLASPYRRTRETAELAFGKAQDSRDLINEIYPGTDDDALAAALRRLLSGRPAQGVNTVLVSHGFNLFSATGLSSAEGETFVFAPSGGTEPVARIGVDDWRSLKE